MDYSGDGIDSLNCLWEGERGRGGLKKKQVDVRGGVSSHLGFFSPPLEAAEAVGV